MDETMKTALEDAVGQIERRAAEKAAAEAKKARDMAELDQRAEYIVKNILIQSLNDICTAILEPAGWTAQLYEHPNGQVVELAIGKAALADAGMAIAKIRFIRLPGEDQFSVAYGINQVSSQAGTARLHDVDEHWVQAQVLGLLSAVRAEL